MTDRTIDDIRALPDRGVPGRPLSPWVYMNRELFELEYDALFLQRWQLVGHVSDIVEVGDFLTADIGRDNVFVIRDKEGQLGAFLNVCRHRASRVLEGTGSCKGVIRCPYHGWTYRLDGSLMAVPHEEDFSRLDRTRYGLHKIQLEVFHGLLFVRVKGNGHSVAQQFSHTSSYFDKYGVDDYVQIATPSTQIWPVNWKIAWDNYLENYHIPIGHPGLNRLIRENSKYGELSSGVSYGEFELRDKLSAVAEERQYQEQVRHADKRVPDELKGKWVQLGLTPNLGIDLYAEMLDLFQIIPLSPDRTMIRGAFYGHRNPTPQEEQLRALNMTINNRVNDEDLQLCTRVQQGLRTHGYTPGPLSAQESSVFNFHEMMRQLLPVTTLKDEPLVGTVASENSRLSE